MSQIESSLSGCLALVVYCSKINGKSTGLLDIQVRWFAESDVAAIRRMIETEPHVVYENGEGQTVA